MKRILAFILCTLLICAIPTVAFATEDSSAVVDPNASVSDNSTTEQENATESEISAPETEEKTITESIVDYVKAHIEELSVIVTLIVSIFFDKLKHGKLTGSIGTLNNNAIAIAENSSTAIKTALDEVEDIADVVKNYKDEIASLLGEIRKSAEEKQSLEATLSHVETFLKTAKLATLELSNEVAELLVLANIPNSKKDELYARHTKAVHELEVAEEVIGNDGKKD
jgi:chromosome segregation ATPase